MGVQKQRWLDRAERYETWAAKAEQQAASIRKSHADRLGDHAMWTQPAYVGTRGGRALVAQRQRIRDALGRAHDLDEKAAGYRSKAGNLRAMAARNAGDAERERVGKRAALDAVLSVGDEVQTLFGVRRVTKINVKTVRVEGVSCAIEKHLCRRVSA